MSRARIYARNLTANWVGYAANLAVMFFMSPFVVHTLGDVQYGVWTLMVSMTGYLGLVELGTRAGVGRFINYHLGKGDVRAVNEVVSTGMAVFLAVNVLLILAAAVIAIALPALFPKIPVDLIPASRIVVLLIALNLWLSFLSAPFQQVLTAHERFDLTNAVDLIVLAVRTLATIWVLLAGFGLVTLALVQLGSNILGQVCVQVLARRIFPAILIRPSLASWSRFRELFGFSIWAFLSAVGFRILSAADTVVIAVILGPQWVTYYVVGTMLLYRTQHLVGKLTSVFSPRMVQDCAREDWVALRRQFRVGNNLAMVFGILMYVGMIAFGREFIILWMGPRFEISYPILTIYASSSLVAVAFSLVGPIYSGLHRVRLSASLVLLEGLANLCLTLILVLGFGLGLVGVAWGTFFPRIIFSVLVGLIAMRWIGMAPGHFFREVAGRWLLLATLFYGVCFIVNLAPWPSGWAVFCVKVAAAMVVYGPLAWHILVDTQTKARLRGALARRLGMLADKPAV
jgi:O-antigen/teichoic acid export membrane protein